eukprot:97935-Amphidinium_carterae.1
MPAPRAESSSSQPGMPQYIRWQLEENLSIHANNSAKLSKQVKQLQEELAASQYDASQLRARNLALRQQMEQVQQTNLYAMQGIQSNTRISQMEREKAC